MSNERQAEVRTSIEPNFVNITVIIMTPYLKTKIK